MMPPTTEIGLDLPDTSRTYVHFAPSTVYTDTFADARRNAYNSRHRTRPYQLELPILFADYWDWKDDPDWTDSDWPAVGDWPDSAVPDYRGENVRVKA